MIRQDWRSLTPFAIILIIFSAFFVVGIGVALASPEQNVCRDLPSGTQAPGSVITVSLDVTVGSATYYGIDEEIPSGWTVTSASDSGDYTSDPGHIRWAVTSGAVDNVYSYTVQIPDAASGTYVFSGVFEMEGMSVFDIIVCDLSITVEGISGDSSDNNDFGTATEDDSESDDESSSVSNESVSITLATENDSETDDESSSASTESADTTTLKSAATTQSPDDSAEEVPAAAEDAGSSMLVIVIGAIVIAGYKLKEN